MKSFFNRCVWMMLEVIRWLLPKRIRDYGQQCQTSGFIPKTSPTVIWLARKVSRFWLWLQVGKVTVIGEENLRLPGRFIYCGNHTSMFDGFVYCAKIERPLRYMGAVEVMRGITGLKAILIGAGGGYPVDRSHGKTVIAPSIQLLVDDSCLSIFPEGKISPDATCLALKMGPAVIGFGALAKLNNSELVGIVPIHFHYLKRDNTTADIYNYLRMGFKWRGGVVITVAKPIYLNGRDPTKLEEIMDEVRQHICGCACA